MKKPPPRRRGFWLVVVSALLAPIPPPSIPPAAGNEYEYALNTKLYRAKNAEKGYVDQAEVVRRNLHASTVRPNGDGNAAAVAAVEETQPGTP
jgi:hypothetical protein